MPENNFTFHIWLLECIVRMNAYIEMSSIQCNFRYASYLYFCQDILLVPGHILNSKGSSACMINISSYKLDMVYHITSICTMHLSHWVFMHIINLCFMLYWHLMRGMGLLTRNFKCDVNWRYFKLHVLTLRDFIGQK